MRRLGFLPIAPVRAQSFGGRFILTAFLRKRRVVPLRYTNDNRVLMVLMEDPTDGEAIADLEKMFRAEIEPVMLRDGSIDQVLGGILDIWSSFSR